MEQQGKDLATMRARRLRFIAGSCLDETNASIERFISTFPEIAERTEAVANAFAETSPDIIQRTIEDFYDAYFYSSGEISQLLGSEKLVRFFRLFAPYAHYITPEAYERFLSLPETISIYRGGRGPKDSLKWGLSWTLNRGIAKSFMDSPGDLVLRLEIPRAKVLKYYRDLDECIIDPDDTCAAPTIVDSY